MEIDVDEILKRMAMVSVGDRYMVASNKVHGYSGHFFAWVKNELKNRDINIPDHLHDFYSLSNLTIDTVESMFDDLVNILTGDKNEVITEESGYPKYSDRFSGDWGYKKETFFDRLVTWRKGEGPRPFQRNIVIGMNGFSTDSKPDLQRDGLLTKFNEELRDEIYYQSDDSSFGAATLMMRFLDKKTLRHTYATQPLIVFELNLIGDKTLWGSDSEIAQQCSNYFINSDLLLNRNETSADRNYLPDAIFSQSYSQSINSIEDIERNPRIQWFIDTYLRSNGLD